MGFWVATPRPRLLHSCNLNSRTPGPRPVALGAGAWAPQVYHLLVDAAVYNAEWPRAVSFIEELIDYGLPRGLRTFGTVAPRPVNYGKHARLLQDVAVDTRNLAALQGAERRALGTDFSSVTETEKVDAPFVQPMERP